MYGTIKGDLLHQLLTIPCGIVVGGGTPCGASWFVITLFFIKCLYDCLSYNKIEKNVLPFIFLLTIILPYLPFKHNYLYIKSVLIGICFFHLGRLCFTVFNKIRISSQMSVTVSIFFFIVSYYITVLNGKVSCFSGSMGNYSLLFYVNAIIGSLGIVFISFFAKKESKIICELSNSSIAVVLLHMAFVDCIRKGVIFLDIHGISLFIIYAICSILIYYLCYSIFKITQTRIPYIWGK